ncbi:MAG TPA: hypothetical protein VMT93_05970 [Gemmatimonadaceae bacterium]|nr:hypothetical protein [Gemmatimonadaceae bacterium]
MMSAPKLVAIAFSAGVLTATAGFAAFHQDQPHMNAALQSLQAAVGHLKEAEHNKGGHRAEAEKLTKEAIEHVKLGFAAGEENAK